MIYAIVEIGGKQFWIEPGRFYDVNRLNVSPGSTISLNKVLLLNRQGNVLVGQPCLDVSIKAKILRHLKSSKVTVFKMKSKKNAKFKKGYRQALTRLLIQEI